MDYKVQLVQILINVTFIWLRYLYKKIFHSSHTKSFIKSLLNTLIVGKQVNYINR